VFVVLAAACSRPAASTSTRSDSVAVITRARAALPSDTAGPMHVASYQADSAGILVDFEVTPPKGFAILGGGILVRVPHQGPPMIISQSR
jgi:hypothetical protein